MERKYLLVGGMVGILVIAGVFLFPGRIEEKKEEANLTPAPTVTLASIEDEVEVTLVKKKGAEEVILTINNIPEDIKSIEYELTYLTYEGLPRGVLGKIAVKGEGRISRDITLGTCSRNVCVYDRNVKKISLALKFSGEKGTRGYQKDFEL